MGVGLQPLEFTECLADSPAFRENLHRHEKELERTSQQIKRLIKEVKDVVQAAKRLGAAQLALAASMEEFEFACIGASMTEDERVISRSLHHFAHLIRTIEDERDRMLGRASEQIIQPLERFRKEHIGAVKEGKKKFDKKTAKFCQTQERTLSLSSKKGDNLLQEADAALDMAERDFCQASLEYVCQLQGVQERKKFELVETLLGFVFGWWTFHHTAHDVHQDAEPKVRDLMLRIQRTRTNFEETSKHTESLMKKMMEVRQMNREKETFPTGRGSWPDSLDGQQPYVNKDKDEEENGQVVGVGGPTRAGYLFLMEKKAFGTTWTKHYVTYERESQLLSLTQYNQINPKAGPGISEVVPVIGARPLSEGSCERRFCWEAVCPSGGRCLQASSQASRLAWLRAVRGPAPPPARAPRAAPQLQQRARGLLRALVQEIEGRGLDEQGLYRVAGVSSKVQRVLQQACSSTPIEQLNLSECETRTLTSALKAFLRNLPDRLLTSELHQEWLAAAKMETVAERIAALRPLVARLEPLQKSLLSLVLQHLGRVASLHHLNLMSAGNLAVCFGPTLLKADHHSVASILDLKFYNVLVETLIEHYHEIFDDPGEMANGHSRTSPTSAPLPASSHTDLWSDCAGASRYSSLHQALLQQFPTGPGTGLSSGPSPSGLAISAPAPPPLPLVTLSHLHGPNPVSRVRTLYACLGESEGELSFEPNQIITNVGPSAEPGWLRGTLNGRTGLVPENYVEPLP